MEKQSSSILTPLPNQPTWLAVAGTSWILCKELFLNKEGVYNLRDKITHRPAEYFEMIEVREILNTEDVTVFSVEYRAWMDLSARCSYIAYNAVKELEIRDQKIKSKVAVIYNLRNKLIVAERNAKEWCILTYIACGALGIVTGLYFLNV